MSTEAIAILLIIGIGLIALLPRNESQNRGLFFLRVLLPSWRFFESHGAVPALYFRTLSAPNQNVDFIEFFPKKKPRMTQLLFNPQGNFDIVWRSYMQQLASDIQTGSTSKDSIETHVIYQLLQNLVCEKSKGENQVAYFQFKIVAQVPLSEVQDDLLISPIIEIKRA